MSFESKYKLSNEVSIDTPSLVIYRRAVVKNIRRMISLAEGPHKLMPHVKSHKIKEIVELQIEEGIKRFKCATIAEAEMVGMSGANEAFIAFQPTDTKVSRLLQLSLKYPGTKFTTLTDNLKTAKLLSYLFYEAGRAIEVYIDLNVGMDRSGIKPGSEARSLICKCNELPGIAIKGLHAYDGHINMPSLKERTKACNNAFKEVYSLKEHTKNSLGRDVELVAGGSPTFPVHICSPDAICSPGTTVLWDYRYGNKYRESGFVYAALVVARVVSIINGNHLCLDLGHKAIAAETPLPRVVFLNNPDAIPVRQSEEHLVVKVPDSSVYEVGSIFYGVPFHICPTSALYSEALIAESGQITKNWKIIARDRYISV